MMATRAYADGSSLIDARNEILAHFRHHNFTDAPQNIAFTVLGLLYGGGDLLKSIILASNCGYDVDCTAATAGAVAGILAGGKAVLKDADATIDERVVVGWGVKGLDTPANLTDLTEQTVELGLVATEETDLPELSPPFSLSRIPAFEPPMRIPCHFDQIPDDIGDEQPLLTEFAQEVIFEGAFFDVEDLLGEPDAMLVIETCLELDRTRKLCLIPHCTAPVALWVDNEKVLQWTDSPPLLPATHRGPRLPQDTLELDAGIHELTIRIKRPDDGRRLEFAWIVADEDKHWVTDVNYVLKP
jgi:hypothetical protein